MQLSDLLSRLTKEERNIAFVRRHVPEYALGDNKMLLADLSKVASVSAAYCELNTVQFRLLEWLAMRSDLQATWREFTDAIGNQIPSHQRDGYLTDLRLLALVDSHPTKRGGYIATYPAAVAPLPSAHRQTLRERLNTINSDVLLNFVSALGVRPSPTRKEERIQAIAEVVTSPDQCHALVKTLSPDAQKLFAWMLERRSDIPLAEMQRQVKRSPTTVYGRAIWTSETLWGGKDKEPVDPLTELMRRSLVVSITPTPGGWYLPTAFFIPEEVRAAYTGQGFFDGLLGGLPQIEAAPDASGTAPNPTNFMRDLSHLLGFVATGRCEARQDGQPYKRSLVAFGKLIQNTDEAYVNMLWRMALTLELVTVTRGGPPDYAIQYGTEEIGKLTPDQLTTHLLSAWLMTGEVTLSRGGAFYTRDNVHLRLLLLLRIMPPDIWVSTATMNAFLRFNWPLVFAPVSVGMGANPIQPPWSTLGRFILALGTTPDGQEALMLPATHQRLMQLLEKGPSVLPAWDDRWTVQPDRTIVAPPNLQPDALVDLWKVAVLESNQGAAVFRVSAASIAAALNLGLTPEQIRTILASRSRTPLPPTVERLIDDQSARYGRIKVGAAETFVQTDDAALMDELRRHAKLKHLQWHDVAPGVAFVKGRSPAVVLDTLRKAGYLPVEAVPPQPAKLATSTVAEQQIVKAPVSTTGKPVIARIIRNTARQAIRDDDDLTITWTEGGTAITEMVTPIDLHPYALHVGRGDGDVEAEIPFESIFAIEIEPYFDYADDNFIADDDFIIDLNARR